MTRTRFAFALLLALLGVPAQANDLVGFARVLDGDTVRIRKFRLRLQGIDAPEGKQTCRKDGQEWACGKASAAALALRIKGQRISCRIEGVDKYDRLLAVCSLDGRDLNEAQVRAGWALAYRRYSLAYVEAEEAAKAEKSGIWAGDFDAPEVWRASHYAR